MDMKDANILLYQKTRTKWWLDKIKKTKERDQNNYKNIKVKTNWNIIVIWECELKNNSENRLEV